MILQLFARDVEARGEVVGVEQRVAALAAGGEQVGEERLQHPEALRRDGRRRPVDPVR